MSIADFIINAYENGEPENSYETRRIEKENYQKSRPCKKSAHIDEKYKSSKYYRDLEKNYYKNLENDRYSQHNNIIGGIYNE